MFKDRTVRILSIYYTVFFMHQGFGSLLTRYMYEVGLTETQVGILTSVPFIIAMCLLPMFGAITDRLPKKKYLIIAVSIIASLGLLLFDSFTDFSLVGTDRVSEATRFFPFLLTLIFTTSLIQAVSPAMTSISIEYCSEKKYEFGPVRMFGTAGFLIGTLIIGFICANSLRYSYSWQALALGFSAIFAFLLPGVKGHQHGGKKISPFVLLKDKKMCLLLGMILVGTVTTMFYSSFYGIYMEQMNISNQIMSVVLFIGAVLEIPALLFAKQLMKLFNVWQWLIIGYVMNGIRWILLFVAMKSGVWALVIISQLLAVSSMTCFEFFPQDDVGKKIAPELSGSAQTLLNVFIFGLPRLFGSLLGGVFCSRFGVGPMFLACGIMLLLAAVIFLPKVISLTKEEKAQA